MRELGDRAGPAGRGRAEGRLARGEGGFLVPAAPRAEWRLGTGCQGVSTWVSGSVKACNRLMKKIPLLFSVSQRSTEVGRATGTATERQSWSATPGRAPPTPRSPASLQEGATHTACVTGPDGAGGDRMGRARPYLYPEGSGDPLEGLLQGATRPPRQECVWTSPGGGRSSVRGGRGRRGWLLRVLSAFDTGCSVWGEAASTRWVRPGREGVGAYVMPHASAGSVHFGCRAVLPVAAVRTQETQSQSELEFVFIDCYILNLSHLLYRVIKVA